MNTSDQPDPSGQPQQKSHLLRGKWRQRKGVALILVISFIVLLSGLVVGFFSRVTTELTSARTYAESISARQLAESAVSIVMGQIRAATTITNGCWASQPGMIRVYGTGTLADAKAYQFYKLYSSHNMVLKAADLTTFNPNNTSPAGGDKVEVPLGTGGWQFQPAYFTDLNEPASLTTTNPTTGTIVTGPNGLPVTTKRYPIFDPSVALIYSDPKSRPQNPDWTKKVEGCEIVLSAFDRQVNEAPMPVRWIYVLKDGTLTAPTPLSSPASGVTGLQANWKNLGNPGKTPSTGVPSRNNPIVGRIAFWTDDDTSKININTAGGFVEPDSPLPLSYLKSQKPASGEKNPAFVSGSFWDTPRVQTYFDRGISGLPGTFRGGLASAQPVRNEFQRYPGHPSTTSLGLALKGLMPIGFNSELLYTMSPRLMSGASQGGTKQLIAYGATINPDVFGITADPPSYQKRTYDKKNEKTIDPKTGNQVDNPSFHLWSSLDEMYYTTLNNPEKQYSAILGNKIITNPDGSRVTANKELSVTNIITPELVDKTRFVLTTHSRSPELNAFGRPRVTIWPIPTKKTEQQLQNTQDPDTKKLGIRNPSDDLFQFVSTVGSDPNPPNDPTANNPAGPDRLGQFIFDREDPYSPTTDFNRKRNKEIFNYLQDITSNSKGKIPGYGQSFEAKYIGNPAGRSQILTEIFDYIRTVNLKDTSRDQRIDLAFGRDVTKLDGKGNPPRTDANAEGLKGSARYAKRGIVVPTRTTVNGAPVSGFGRFPTVSEVSLVFYCGGYIYKAKDKDGTPTGAELVEYDYRKVDERNIATASFGADVFFKNNVLTHKLMRAFLVIETFNPMQGYGPVTGLVEKDPKTGQLINERIVYEIPTQPGFRVKSPSMTQDAALDLKGGKNNVRVSSGDTWAGRNFGGTEGFFHTMQDKTSINIGDNSNLKTSYYPFQTPCFNKTDGIKIPVSIKDSILNPVRPEDLKVNFDSEFSFTGGAEWTIEIRYLDNALAPLSPHNSTVPLQTLKLKWPDGPAWPVPITEREAGRWKNSVNRADVVNNLYKGIYYSGEGFRQVSGGFDPSVTGNGEKYTFNSNDGNAMWPGSSVPQQWSNAIPSNPGFAMAYYLPARIAWSQRHSWYPWNGVDRTLNNIDGKQVANGKNYFERFKQIIQPGDTVRSLQAGDPSLPEGTDMRTTFLQQSVVGFKPHPDYNKTDANPNATRRAQSLRSADGQFYFPPTDPVWFPGESAKLTSGVLAQLPANTRYLGDSAPDLVKGVQAKQKGGKAGDFDTGIGNFPDGPFCGKADEGNISRSWIDAFGLYHYVEPYFSTFAYDSPGDTYFSPNRQIPSPVMFGSLLAPNTDLDKSGWKTLLFCPNPASGAKSATDTYNQTAHHHGFANPPDHLLLDLFNMPVVEPYAISEPFSTDGKVNLNYQLMPFGYIERSTALRAALHPLRITAIPSAFSRTSGGINELAYKGFYNEKNKRVDNEENLRYLVDREETLKGFKAFFDRFGPGNTGTGFFKTASQICEMFLYPKGQPVSSKGGVRGAVTFTPGDTNIKQWWTQCAITGDNVREKPYSDLYSRVTTKSNTYTVHYRVQSLRQQPFNGDPTSPAADTYYQTWDETRDKVLSEYRGHTTIERYLDPRDSRFTFTSTNPAPPQINPEKQSLEAAYRFRVVYNKRFSPW